MTKLPSPTPAQLREARKAMGFTMKECAELINATYKRWWEWEAGSRKMKRNSWELFLLKTGLKE